MKVVLKSNIDAYKGLFPSNFTQVPRVGEMVSISNPSVLNHLKLPPILEVKQVIWFTNYVEVDLHYSEIQIKSMSLSKINMFP